MPALSKKIWFAIAIRPESGTVSPAMQSSSVVFPAPDGPKRIVMPAGMANAALSSKSPPPANRLRICADSTPFSDERGVRKMVFFDFSALYFHGHTAHTLRFRAYTTESTTNEIASSSSAIVLAAA